MTDQIPSMPEVNTISFEDDDFEAVNQLRLWGRTGWSRAEALEAERDALKAQVAVLPEALEVLKSLTNWIEANSSLPLDWELFILCCSARVLLAKAEGVTL